VVRGAPDDDVLDDVVDPVTDQTSSADHPRRSRFFRELPGMVLLAFALALLIKTFFFQAFFIPSGSMEPTLVRGDRVIVNKIPYYLHDPRRGDVIVFSNPNGKSVDRGIVGGFFHWLGQGLGLTGAEEPSCGDTNPDEDFIKRVIGLPGDTVEGRGGAVWVDGKKLTEPYLAEGGRTEPFAPVDVPPGKLFVMGDNRGNSCDSRFALGMVPEDHVIGRAVVIIWPPSRMGFLH
jgi:signal peptidase I